MTDIAWILVGALIAAIGVAGLTVSDSRHQLRSVRAQRDRRADELDQARLDLARADDEVRRLTLDTELPDPGIDGDTRSWLAERVPIPDAVPGIDPQDQPRWEQLRCPHCQGIHFRACPRVREIEYDGGQVKRVVFWQEGRYNDDDVIWPDMIFTDPAEAADT